MRASYCAAHNTHPLPDEPCWQCVNKWSREENKQLVEAGKELGLEIAELKGQVLRLRSSAPLAASLPPPDVLVPVVAQVENDYWDECIDTGNADDWSDEEKAEWKVQRMRDLLKRVEAAGMA